MSSFVGESSMKTLNFPFFTLLNIMIRYGDGVGMYRTHLFGSPSIIACFPSINKFIFQSENIFILQWPRIDIVGPTSLVAVHGKSHTRLRSFVSKSINRADALRRIALHVQPRMVAALQSWAQRGKLTHMMKPRR